MLNEIFVRKDNSTINKMNNAQYKSNSKKDLREVTNNLDDHSISIHVKLTKPLSTKNVLINNMGDFRTLLMPQRKNYSSQSINKMRMLDDIQEEKDDMEMSLGFNQAGNNKQNFSKFSFNGSNPNKFKSNSKFNSHHNLINNKFKESLGPEVFYNSDTKLLNKIGLGLGNINTSNKESNTNTVKTVKKNTLSTNKINEEIKATGSNFNKKNYLEDPDNEIVNSSFDSSCFNSGEEDIENGVENDIFNLSREIKIAQKEILRKNHEVKQENIVKEENEDFTNSNIIQNISKNFSSVILTDNENIGLLNDLNMYKRRRSSFHTSEIEKPILKELKKEASATFTLFKKDENNIKIDEDKNRKEKSNFNNLGNETKRKRSLQNIIVNNNISINVINPNLNDNNNTSNNNNNYEIKLISNNDTNSNIRSQISKDLYSSMTPGNKNISNNNLATINNNFYNNYKNNINPTSITIPINYDEQIKNFKLFSKNTLFNLINLKLIDEPVNNNLDPIEFNFVIYCSNSIPVHNLLNHSDNLKNKIINLNKTTVNGLLFSNFIKKLLEIIKEDYNIKKDKLLYEDYNINEDEIEIGPYSLGIINNHNDNEENLEYKIINKKIINIIIRKIKSRKNRKNEDDLFYILIIEKTESISNENSLQVTNIMNNNHNNLNNLRQKIQMSPRNINALYPNYSLNNTRLLRRSSLIHPNFLENESFNGTMLSPQLNLSMNRSNSFRPNSNKGLMNSNSFLLYNAKVSALLHDFKHTIIDSNFFLEAFIKKYEIQAEIDDLMFLRVMDEYVSFLIKNITEFMKDPENFFKVKSDYSSQNVDLVDIIEIMIKVFNRRLEWENEEMKKTYNILKDVKIHCNIINKDNEIYKKVKSERNLLMCLFYNILSNSFKFTEKGEIFVETKIVNNKEILVKIIDTGPGLSEKVLKNWSKPFNMENNIKNPSGTGLGQFIMSTIVKNLKLEMPLPERNPRGEGTVIKIIIPINPPKENSLNKSDTCSFNTRKMTLDNPSAYYINPFEKDYVNYVEDTNNNIQMNINSLNYLNNIPVCIKSFKIICFDDDRLVINSIVEKMKINLKNLAPKIKFEFDLVFTFDQYFDCLANNLVDHKYTYDFFLLDQNVSLDQKGDEIAELTKSIYSAYLGQNFERKKLNFLFVTEQSDELKLSFKNKNKKYFKEDQIFGKRDHEAISHKLISIINNEFSFY